DADAILERLSRLRKGKVSKVDAQVNPTLRYEPEIASFDEIYKIQEKIATTQLKGIKEISKVIMVKEKGEGQDEWVLYAEGSNLSAVLTIEGVDPTRVTTNNIQEILETLGVEAARGAIISESLSVLRDQGLEVDIRHLLLVADLMAQNGTIRQIGRHGISGEKESVLAKAGFEVTVKHLLESAAYGKLDHLRGITENVIIGQIIPVGTGTVELIMFPGPGWNFGETEAEPEFIPDSPPKETEKAFFDHSGDETEGT
ncbi:MAG TPA: hypothetical protein VJ044_10655, partial [Candidatus Hodarchaeales archaeon]|nr:hypothetical protein [Candidatus Hodarchaeales archaeon]